MKKFLIATLLFFTHTIQAGDKKQYNTFDNSDESSEVSDTSTYYQLASHAQAANNTSKASAGYQKMNKPTVSTDNSTVDGSNASDSDKDSPVSITPPSLSSLHEEDTQKQTWMQRVLRWLKK